jgi:hypothetical protein
MSRVALLNDFSVAGSEDTALLLEELPKVVPVMARDRKLQYIFGLSAKDNVAIEKLCLKYRDFLRSPDSSNIPLSDLAYTSTAQCQIYGYRMSVSASTREVERLAKSTFPPRMQTWFLFSLGKAASTLAWAIRCTNLQFYPRNTLTSATIF